MSIFKDKTSYSWPIPIIADTNLLNKNDPIFPFTSLMQMSYRLIELVVLCLHQHCYLSFTCKTKRTFCWRTGVVCPLQPPGYGPETLLSGWEATHKQQTCPLVTLTQYYQSKKIQYFQVSKNSNSRTFKDQLRFQVFSRSMNEWVDS